MSMHMLTIKHEWVTLSQVMFTQESWETHEIYHPIIASEYLPQPFFRCWASILIIKKVSRVSIRNYKQYCMFFVVYWLVCLWLCDKNCQKY